MLKEEQYYKDLWFKLSCFYHAQTELFDRGLTDLRSPYDKTEAYFSTVEDKRFSNWYAIRTRKFVIEVARKLSIPKSIIQTGFNKHLRNLSAQGWIDLYNQMVTNGEMDFIDELRMEKNNDY